MKKMLKTNIDERLKELKFTVEFAKDFEEVQFDGEEEALERVKNAPLWKTYPPRPTPTTMENAENTPIRNLT